MTRLFKMYDWGTDLQGRYGVPVGAVHHWAWDDLEPRQGQYNWAKVDQAMEKEIALGKAVMARIIMHYSSSSRPGYPANTYLDATPDWVYAGGVPHKAFRGRKVGHVIVDAHGRENPIPAYDQRRWQDCYLDFVDAFATRYDSALAAVVISAGLDGETQPAKHEAMRAIQQGGLYAGIEHRWGQFLDRAIDMYADVFTDATALLNNAPGGQARRSRAEKIAALDREGCNVGLQHSGLLPDIDSHSGWGSAFDGTPTVGSWDMMRELSGIVPLALESAHWIPGPLVEGHDSEVGYWSLHHGLTYRPDWIILHSDWFDKLTPETLEWAHEHLGFDPPSAWTVLRDSEFEPSSWGRGGYQGMQGNYEFMLRQTNASITPRVWRYELPNEVHGAVESRQCRKIDGVATFEIDPAFAREHDRFTVTVRCLRADSPMWQNVTFEVQGRQFEIEGEGLYIHRVWAFPVSEPEPEPEPEPGLSGIERVRVIVTLGDGSEWVLEGDAMRRQ